MPTTLIVETEPPGNPVPFSGPTADLVYFLSFAYASRFGADHELAEAARRLQRRYKLDLRPLITFADSEPSDAGEREELARAWQDAARLADTAQAAADRLAGDEELQQLLTGYPDLIPRLAELAQIARRAAEQNSKVRLSFKLG